MKSFLHVALALLAAALACTGFVTHRLTCSYDPGTAREPTLPCAVALGLSKEFSNYEYVTPQTFSSAAVDASFGPGVEGRGAAR